MLANQKTILKNQATLLKGQGTIVANQKKIQANQVKIQANQKTILGNQKKLDQVLANQKALLARCYDLMCRSFWPHAGADRSATRHRQSG